MHANAFRFHLFLHNFAHAPTFNEATRVTRLAEALLGCAGVDAFAGLFLVLCAGGADDFFLVILPTSFFFVLFDFADEFSTALIYIQRQGRFVSAIWLF